MQIWKNISNQFLRLFFPAALVFGLIVVYFYSSEIEKERIVLEATESLHLNLGRQVIEKDLEAAIDDLRVLSEHSEFDKIDAPLHPEALDHLAQEFLAFVRSKGYYDQIRFLDEDGKEAIRINLGSGHPYIVPKDQLQDKSGRYYFKNTLRLNDGEIFISPMDLNIEHSKIEIPAKPIIRLASTVFYGQEKKRGIVILNYLGSSLVRNFKEVTVGISDHAMLLNTDGYWLYSFRPELEWGFMLGHDHRFDKQFPSAWERITKMSKGHFYNSKGLFTFDTVYPLGEGVKSSVETTVSDGLSSSEIKDKEFYWKVVAHVSREELDAVAATITMKLLMVSIPLLGLLAVGVWWLALAQVRRLEAEEELTKRVRQQSAVVVLGQCALSGEGCSTLMNIVVDYVAVVLEVEYCNIMELLPDDETLLLRAGVGWRKNLVGHAIVGTGMDSQAGYTLACKEPVIVEDLRKETRFTGSQLLHDHGVVSGMSVIVHGMGKPFGVLGVYTSKQRIFSNDDIYFLQAVVNILSEVIEREFAQAKTRLQTSALTAVADGIVITDRDGRIEWVNPAYTQLTGYSSDEAVGLTPRILKSGKQDHAFYKKLWDTILSDKTWYGELYNKRKDGSLYLEEESITPVLDQSGEITHFVAIKRDITESKHLQKQLQQSQKMEAIGQLTGGIAHDFNNMLTSIMGYTELVRERLAQSGDKKIKDHLGEIYKSGKRARDLVTQMLAFSRGGEGELKPYKLSPLIKESLKMLGSTLPSSIEIDLQLDSDDLTIMTNPVQLHQLIMNLCINARDAMDGKGHITIGLQCMNNLVTECHSCHEKINGDYIQLFVRDTGSGIKPEQLAHIFEPFYTTKDVGKGTGMGLSMVHGIVHDHGGHIVVETESGKGTSFILLFPAIDVQVDPVNMEDSDTKATSVQILDANVLIVDDEVSVGHFIGDLLKGYGCQVTVESDSQLALSKFKNSPNAFDLVVTDQTMPGMTGVELAQSVMAIRPELPVILCTGYSDHIDEARAKSLGISGYVNKPIETDEFLGLIGELL